MGYFKYLLLLLILSGCKQSRENNNINIPSSTYGMQVIKIDSCEYIYYRGYKELIVTHKGNCKFCSDRNSAKKNLKQK